MTQADKMEYGTQETTTCSPEARARVLELLAEIDGKLSIYNPNKKENKEGNE